MSFAHLHVHTMYSLLDGFSNIKKLVKRVKEMGMPAVAITDHGTMFGSIDFFNSAKAEGVKPIIGLEGYLSARRMYEKESRDKRSSHLLLLAENQTGYQNLLKIASAAQLEGFYYHPRIDHEFLAEHSEGLIATSGCLAAEIPRALKENDVDLARQKIAWYFDVFGRDRFYLELQDHPIEDLTRVNNLLLELGKTFDARYVATNDVHYIEKSDARYQDILLAIQTGSLLSDPNRMKMGNDTYYLRSPEEMQAVFGHVPGAIENTLEIAERCNVNLKNDEYHLPRFDVPPGCTTETYLRSLCEEGFIRKYGQRARDPKVRERLDYELSVIHNMGFDAYFLIVWDLCMYAKREGIWYNARGSAAGSIVAYCLDITMVEPLDHGLIFERFLNPSRISMPDIDLDFQDDKRSCLIKYCADKFGHDKVAAIITFSTLGAKAAIRDVGRVMDIPLSEVDRVSKLIPSTPSRPITIPEALEEVFELKQLYETTPHVKELIDTAQHMEGVVRNVGTHAAGIVITDEPVVNYVPIHRPTSNSDDTPVKLVTQYEMSHLDALGLLKVDFLGLASLTIMERACEMIKSRQGPEFTLENIPVDDPDTFEFLGTGHTAGVFQLEGSGMTRYIVQMQPKNLAQIIAMVALYRPGPLDFIPSYIKRMHDEEEVSYRHPSLEPIFNETYGIPIYQEQIMFAAMQIGGYTASDADGLRKAISKKKAKEIQLHRAKFVSGAVAHNVMDQSTAEAIFTDWENFARYGFNKSHAADYGIIAVQTAYLKKHFTVEYMTALLSASKNDTDKVAFYVSDCRDLGIEILPPDVNKSQWDFSIEDRSDGKAVIRFGLGAIKNVGLAPVQNILDARKEGGPFVSINDFARRVDLRQVGKRALESLVRVGALDQFGDRRVILEALDRITAVSGSHFKASQAGQMSIFGLGSVVVEEIELPKVSSLQVHELLEWEKELIGLYVSSHPLQPYLQIFKEKKTTSSTQLVEAKNKSSVVVGGRISRYRRLQTKKGQEMCFATLEDVHGPVELVVFPKTWDRVRNLIQMDRVLIVEGKVDNDNGDPKILVDSISEPVLDTAAAASELTDTPARPTEAVESDLVRKYEIVFGGENEKPAVVGPQVLRNEPPIFVSEVSLDKVGAGETTLFKEECEESTAAADEEKAEFPAVIAANSLPPLRPAETPTQYEDEDGMPPPPDFPDDWHQTGPMLAEDEKDEEDYSGPRGGTERFMEKNMENSQSAAVEVQQVTRSSKPMLTDLPAVLPPMEIFNTTKDSDKQELYLVTVLLRSNVNEVDRGVLRMQRVIGLLRSYPGRDRFNVLVFERGKPFQLEFPNDTTGYCAELLRKLRNLVGEENVQVKIMRVH